MRLAALLYLADTHFRASRRLPYFMNLPLNQISSSCNVRRAENGYFARTLTSKPDRRP